MADEVSFDDHEMEVAALSFAARLLFSDLDRELMVQRGLESLADLSRSQRVGLLLLDAQGEGMEEAVGMHQGRQESASLAGELTEPRLLEVMETKQPQVFGLELKHGLPWPTETGAGQPDMECLVAPLVAANNKVVGLATMAFAAGRAPAAAKAQPLIIFLAVLALALEVTRLLTLAVTDGLTGLYVRRYFDIRLDEELARLHRYGGRLSLAVVDLDHFKAVNDNHGHQCGDRVLADTAVLLNQTVRKNVDVVCRYGGEEFALILPNTDLAGALGLCRRLRQAFAAHSFRNDQGEKLSITFSAGVADTGGQEPLEAGELFRRADKALYAAKGGGRDRTEAWHADLEI